MGYAFAFNTVALLSVAAGQPVPVGAYVHYPTISTTMVSRVRARAPGVTNATAVASSSILSHAKLLCVPTLPFTSLRTPYRTLTMLYRYYRIFMHLYQRSLARASFLMVNSSWTRAHVSSVLTHTDPAISRLCTLGTFLLPPVLMLVRLADRARPQRAASPETVYPSCDTREMAALPLGTRERLVLSIAQFRCVYASPYLVTFPAPHANVLCQAGEGPRGAAAGIRGAACAVSGAPRERERRGCAARARWWEPERRRRHARRGPPAAS